MDLKHTYRGVMSRLARQTAAIAVSLVALVTGGACDDPVSVQTPPEDGPAPVYRAGFYVTTGASGTPAADLTSRAPSPGDYEAGMPVENYIDIDGKDFSILMFDSEDVYVGALDNVLVTPAGSDGTYKTYYVSGVIPAAVPDALGGRLKVMMLANWRGSYPAPQAGVTTLGMIATDAASRYGFVYPDDTQIGPGRYIPMFGVTDLLTGLRFESGWSTDLGTIHMLRAYAQVRVRAREGSLPIESVRLTRANNGGYRAPVGVTAQADYVHGSYADDYYRRPSVPSDVAVVRNVSFTADEDGCWRIYVPEFVNLVDPANPRNPLAADERCRIEVKFEGDMLTHYIDFKYYNDPPSYAAVAAKEDYFNLLRNNIYDYTLNRIAGESEVTVEVDVIPYSEVKLAPEFGLDRDSVTGWIIVKKWEKTYYYDDKADRFYDENKMPVAKRVELSENDLYVIRDTRTREVRYTYDLAEDKYWLDMDRTTEFTDVRQYEKYLIRTSITTGFGEKDVLVMWKDNYGSVIALFNLEDGKVYDKNFAPRDYIPNYGYKIWKDAPIGYPEYKRFMVIGYDYQGTPQFFYDPVTGKYYYDGVAGNIVLKEVEAYPPLK